MITVLILFVVAFVAGLIDAIAGGGGLLTVPALLTAGLPPHVALGTNKAQSLWGSGAALFRYFHSPLLHRNRVLSGFFSAFAGSLCGTALLNLIAPDFLKPLVIALLLSVALFMVFYRPRATDAPPVQRGNALAIAVATIIGAYDGFFGPGTGTFLIVAYVLLWRDPLDEASANAKVANFASNISSFFVFAALGRVYWPYALPMAAGQFLGGVTGAHFTVRRGVPIVRVAVLLVTLALIARVAWSMLAR